MKALFINVKMDSSRVLINSADLRHVKFVKDKADGSSTVTVLTSGSSVSFKLTEHSFKKMISEIKSRYGVVTVNDAEVFQENSNGSKNSVVFVTDDMNHNYIIWPRGLNRVEAQDKLLTLHLYGDTVSNVTARDSAWKELNATEMMNAITNVNN